MFGIGQTELLILAGILTVVFGASRLPSLMRNMGRSVNEFKQGLKDEPKKLDEDQASSNIESEREKTEV